MRFYFKQYLLLLTILNAVSSVVSGGHDCDANTFCNGHGTCTLSHSVEICTCDDGWLHSDCSVECSDDAYCNSHGKSHFHNGACTCHCDDGFSGGRCISDDSHAVAQAQATTAATSNQPVQEQVQCHDNTFCNGNGRASNHNHVCQCTCNDPFYGDHCENECTCGGHGHVHFHNGVCTCNHCDAGYFGALCEIECTDKQTCHGNGAAQFDANTNACKCTCHGGFSGSACSKALTTTTTATTTPTTTQPHIVCGDHTFCSGNGKASFDHNNVCRCDCHNHFFGTNCENECSDSGFCNGNGHAQYFASVGKCYCTCSPTFTGTNCDIAPEDPCQFRDCSGHGTCSVKADGHTHCRCNHGFEGHDCQTCNSAVLCSGQGTCDSRTGHCACFNGYKGHDCAIETCQLKDCNGHGTCSVNGEGHAHCKCDTGFEGHDCEACNSAVLCSGQGTCDDSNGQCSCGSHYHGHDCSIECSDNGFCSGHGAAWFFDSVQKCYCTCRAGYSGTHCEVGLTDPCHLKNCSGHGTCSVNTDGNAHCACDQGFTGTDCDGCDSAKLCNGQGVCDPISRTCACAAGYHGQSCNIDCSNDGHCNGRGTALFFDSVQKCYCTCQLGYSGLNCELNPCQTQTCNSHGICVLDAQGGSSCTCDPGYFGANCTECLDADFCNNHGNCVVENGHQRCHCSTGFYGARCHFECTESNNCNGHGKAVHRINHHHHHLCACICDPDYTGRHCDQVIGANSTATTFTTSTDNQSTTTLAATTTSRPAVASTTTTVTTSTVSTTTVPSTSSTVLPNLTTNTCDKINVDQYMQTNTSVSHNDAPVCRDSLGHESTEALVMSYCNRTQSGTWAQGLKVMDDCSAVPLYSPIGTFVHGTYPTGHGLSGVFLGCIADGFTILVQGCGSPPTQLQIRRNGINLMDPDFYYFIL